jgi:sugar lactone lactonase YvrE
MSLARDLVDRIFFPNRDVHAIPVLDGAFSPNQRLEQARTLGSGPEAPDDLVFGPPGTLYVSSGNSVFAASGTDHAEHRGFVSFDAPAGGLAYTPQGNLLVCVAGKGVFATDAAGNLVHWLKEVDGRALTCPTAVTVASDGTVFITEGSQHNVPQDWLRDLMQARPGSGRLIACSPELTRPRVLAEGLSWPHGVAVTHDEEALLVTESWTHRLSLFGREGGAAKILVRNFAGYPARIVRGAADDYWMAFFALRTQLTEFVLRERNFREKMMLQVPPELWIGPTLGGAFDYREPTQIGRIKKLGIQKPWAPARSYGLVARIDGEGNGLESFHSRAAGTVHGVTAVRAMGPQVVAASKGNGRIVELPIFARN